MCSTERPIGGGLPKPLLHSRLFIWPCWLLTSGRGGHGLSSAGSDRGDIRCGVPIICGGGSSTVSVDQLERHVHGNAAHEPLLSRHGAKVGPNCTISTPFCQRLRSRSHRRRRDQHRRRHSYPRLPRRETAHLISGPRDGPANDCFIGVHCNLGLDVAMENQSLLEYMSMLADGAIGRAWAILPRGLRPLRAM